MKFAHITSAFVGVFSEPFTILPPLDPAAMQGVFGEDVELAFSMTLPTGFIVQKKTSKPPKTELIVAPDRIQVVAPSCDSAAELTVAAVNLVWEFQREQLKSEPTGFRVAGLNTEFEFGPVEPTAGKWIASKFIQNAVVDRKPQSRLTANRIEFQWLEEDDGHAYRFRLEPRATDPKLVFVYCNDEIPVDGLDGSRELAGSVASLSERLERAYQRAGRLLLRGLGIANPEADGSVSNEDE